MFAPGQRVSVAVEKPAAGGRMIARVDGQVVLVAGAIPGEHVVATIERVGRGVAYARTTDVETASPDRRVPFTEPDCGGCAYAHIAYTRQLALKGDVIADAFQRIGKLPVTAPIVVASVPADGYRMRARLHLRDGRLAFFREGTHRPCDPRSTRQLLPATCDVLEGLAERLSGTGGTGIREIEVSETIEATARAVHCDATQPVDPASLADVAGIEGLTGVTVTGVGGEAVIVDGTPYVEDRLDVGGNAVTLRRHVLSFFQANRHLVRDLVAHVVGHVASGSTVIDLYAGVGLFAIPISMGGNDVTAVEGDRVSAQDLQANAMAHGGSLRAIHRPVETFLERQPKTPHTLIVDPPRTGMSREAIHAAVELASPRVVYVSCDVATLARDARRFVDAGYAMTSMSAFDMFPNTAHVETVVVFDRS